jgi:hypothetical protein
MNRLIPSAAAVRAVQRVAVRASSSGASSAPAVALHRNKVRLGDQVSIVRIGSVRRLGLVTWQCVCLQTHDHSSGNFVAPNAVVSGHVFINAFSSVSYLPVGSVSASD